MAGKLKSGTAWQAVINKAFVGNKRIKTGAPQVIACNAAANSTIIPVSKVGTLAYDEDNDDAYICTVANTTWVKINA
jgi:hypothetical protein